MAEQRPNPDSLLDLVNNDRSITTRGRLKIFFGASAGVGKTYAMLSEARRRLNEGIDVVIGVVETHGRNETAQLIEGIPTIPPLEVTHRGIKLKEFDLESALERKPSLILIDECAHTNAPNSRHSKRWQDIEELLNSGIDVYTTLNVQHLESINDLVVKLTGIQVRETIPDRIFDEADDIALIDIPSDELLIRLHEGKVYIAPGANQRAAENFFKKSNLISLRELALRRTAERVDAESDVLSAARGEKEAQIGQKILVCIGHDATSTAVIRHARRMASRAKAPWYVIYVETARHSRLTDKARRTAEGNLRLAEKIGARIVRVTGSNACEEILNYARNNGVTRIVVGHKRQFRFTRLFTRTLSSELIENGGGMEITTVTEDYPEEQTYTTFWGYYIAKPSSYIMAIGILAFATLLGLPIRDRVNSDNLTMIYLTSVVIIAAHCGTGPSIFASILSVLAFNFFFTEPYYTFEFYDKGYYFTFTVMLVTSLIVGSLAAKLALQAQQSRKREQETHLLYSLARELSSARGIVAMAEVAIKHIGQAFDAIVTIFLPMESGLQAIPENSPAHDLKEESVARWVIENRRLAGRQTDTLPSAKGSYFSLVSENTALGVLGIMPKDETRQFSIAEISQLETFSSVIASALQRAHNAESAEKAKIESESEKLRNVLLSSVSHDLRTPLASITGAASSTLMLKEKLPKEVIEALRSIHSQAGRLAKLVTNLLDVTSLEAGKIKLNSQPYFIAEVIGSALKRVEESKGKRNLTIEVSKNLPLIEMDGLLIEQVLVNLLDNAIRYTEEEGKIIISAKVEADCLRITVRDNGVGLPKGEENKIFEKFYTRGHRTEGNAGLGLAICKGIVEAHNGSITGRNNKDSGTTISFTLPGLKPMVEVHE